MARCLLAALLVAACAPGAAAYDFLYTGCSAMTGGSGEFDVAGGLAVLVADEYYDHAGEVREVGADWSAVWIPIEVSYSPVDRLEIGLAARFGVLDREATGEVGDSESHQGAGLGDTWLWAKYRFLSDPVLSVRAGVALPTGSAPEAPPLLGNGFYGLDDQGDIAAGRGATALDGAVLLGVPAGPGRFDAAVGYRYFMAREVNGEIERGVETYDHRYGGEIHFSAGFAYFLGQSMDFTVAADGFFGSEAERTVDGRTEEVSESASYAVWLNPAFDYMMGNGLSIRVDAQWMIVGQNALIEKGVGVYVGWGT